MRRMFLLSTVVLIILCGYKFFFNQTDSWLTKSDQIDEKYKIKSVEFEELDKSDRTKAIKYLKNVDFLKVKSYEFGHLRNCRNLYVVRAVKYVNRGEPLEVYFRDGNINIVHNILSSYEPQTTRTAILVCTPNYIISASTAVYTTE